MKILYYPGSFDPPHRGQLKAFQQAIEHVRPSVSMMLPVYPASSIGEGPEVDAFFRRTMCGFMVEECLPPSLSLMANVDAFEPTREDPACTLEIARYLRDAYPTASELWMLMDKEASESCDSWHGVTGASALTHILATRDADRRGVELSRRRGFRVEILNQKPSPITSASVRAIFAADARAPRAQRYVSPGALRVIRENGFYGQRRPAWASL